MKSCQLVKFAGFSTLLLLSAGSMAGEKGLSSFEALDQNRDGRLSATEASRDRELSKRWSEIDQDESGTIDRVEFSAFEMMQPREMKTQRKPFLPPFQPEE
ncbi:MAG: Ca2+-binding EF-hand superfamily protein [Motiliproteus sp.]|jgi:Ca2+-binding EF-hand superfamily protein